jgi:hypothetical protein
MTPELYYLNLIMSVSETDELSDGFYVLCLQELHSTATIVLSSVYRSVTYKTSFALNDWVY